MSEELLINVNMVESRVAILENGVVSEIYIERHNKMGLVGNIYLGTVVRILPGMQAGFIDIGEARTAFLHLNDMQLNKPGVPKPKKRISVKPKEDVSLALPESETADQNLALASDSALEPDVRSIWENAQNSPLFAPLLKKSNRPARPVQQLKIASTLDVSDDQGKNATSTQKVKSTPKNVKNQPLIQNLLHEGQRILVQVIKDELGSKGARLTTDISLPSRYLVYLPFGEHIGVSNRIDDLAERQRLQDVLYDLMRQMNLTGGLIARTAAENVPKHKLEEDVYYLVQLWRTIVARQQQGNHNHSSVLIYQELSLPFRSIRDLVHEGTEKVTIDEAQTYEMVCQFVKEFIPTLQSKIAYYTGNQPLFDAYRVEEDLQNALKKRVDLKSGGYLIIDQTEAMTTIDVNTGSFIGGQSLEDTVYKTNLEATHAIAHQLRLRNLGGIIILDFIDMQEQAHKNDVLTSLQQQLAKDHTKTNITQISELGLIEMTRKRTRESLVQQLCEPCPTCQGRGMVKTAETICFEIFREIMRCARVYKINKQFTVVANPVVIEMMLANETNSIADLEYLLGKAITFKGEYRYTQEQYNIVLD